MGVVIDLFCGAGGESQGIHWAMDALGIKAKLYAINHWELAIESHSKNFPSDESICQSIQQVNPANLVPGRRVELLWASPECTHFSIARGGKPMDDQSRCTPWDILRFVEMLDVKRIIIENVPEFRTWGPLDSKTLRPIAEAKGSYFAMFLQNLKTLGYSVDYRILNAANYGAPTCRRRLFIQAVKGRNLILWPEQTHAEEAGLFGCKKWVPASEVIDLNIPTTLLEDRARPLSPKTMKRIMQGIGKYWGAKANPFITRYNGGENRNHSIHDPLPVLDTSNRYGVVEPLVMATGHTSSTHRTKPVSAPLSTVVTKAEHCLIEPLIMEYYGNGQCKPTSSPVGVVTTKDRFAVVQVERLSIGFRMLQPHELAAAQSFPRGYFFSGNKSDQVKQIGNAVPPLVAEALAKAVMGSK